MRILIIDDDPGRREAVARAMRGMNHECVAVGHQAIRVDTSLLSGFGAVLMSMDLRRQIGADVTQQLARHPGVALGFIAAGTESDDQIAEAQTMGPVLPTQWSALDLARLMEHMSEPRPWPSRRAPAGTPQWHRRSVDVHLANWYAVEALCEGKAYLHLATDEHEPGTILTLIVHLPSGAVVDIPGRVAVVTRGNGGSPISFLEPRLSRIQRDQLLALARRDIDG